jgi:hypothetical protein
MSIEAYSNLREVVIEYCHRLEGNCQLSNRQTLIVESIMSSLKKSDCISIEDALKEAGVVRNTLNAYMNVLNIPKHKFPLDRKVYITKVDFERVKELMEENR